MSNNNNAKELSFYMRKIMNNKIETNPKNRQQLRQQKVGFHNISTNKQFTKAPTVALKRRNLKYLSNPLLSDTQKKNLSLIRKVQSLGKDMVLHHSSPYNLNVQPNNIIFSPRNTHFHTNPDWKYGDPKTNIVAYVPVNIVEKEGKQSLAFFQNKGNGYGYGTVIMPRELPLYICNTKINNQTGACKIVAVYDKTLNQRQERIVNGFVFRSSNKKK